MADISFYIHIPFCGSKCLYCDFLSYSGREKYISAYVKALIAEIKAFKTDSRVISVFFGGGTPSVIDEHYTAEIMAAIRDNFRLSADAEITTEANPGTVTEDKLKAYRACGINRISFGVQAMQDRLLKRIGRIHTAKQAAESVRLARSVGFDNINCDLMFSLPEQTCNDFLESIDEVTALGVTHISAYSLIIEEGTPFYDKFESGEFAPVDEDEDRKMYHEAVKLLAQKGFDRYEISNFAQKDRQCRHNLVYWYRGDYKGFGLGASSLVNEVRYKNTEDFYTYINGNNNMEKEILTVKDMQEEFMFLGLRCDKGVSESDFKRSFGKDIDSVYGKPLAELAKQGLITRKNDRIALTERGFDIANMVFVEFMQ